MSDVLQNHPLIGRTVRGGTWKEQGVSTFRIAADAVREGRLDDACSLARYTVQEASEGHELYPVFIERARSFLINEGISKSVVDAEEDRIRACLRLPDGSEFDPTTAWSAYTALIDEVVRACNENQREAALDLLERGRLTLREGHDRHCDIVYGFVDVCARYLGEDRVGAFWDALMRDFYPSRDRYDVAITPWPESFEVLMTDGIESLRGHLSGPSRMGDVEVIEEENRWALRFDPCGSGGRTMQPDMEGGPPRMESPYNFAVTTAEHDWAWNRKGVCLYCVHCCQLQERVPIKKFGYPVRVVEPPIWPSSSEGAKCTWYVYKEHTCVEPELYQRVGLRKPSTLAPPQT